MSHLGTSPFTYKERRVYFGASLILGNGRCALLMLISIYPFSALGLSIYMRVCLLLLDRRRVFKSSSLICIWVHLLFEFLCSTSMLVMETREGLNPDLLVEMEDNLIGKESRRSWPDYNRPETLRLSNRYTISYG
jgi:hypothetical protein